MSYEIVTVATHKEFKFEELINNKFEKITVLGMGQKWTGYKMKSQLVYDYIKNMDDNKIIIFLDGFDSVIQNDPKKAIEIFKEGNYKFLISKDINNGFNRYTGHFIFPHCKNNMVASCGMYMGYVKYLKQICESSFTKKCKDDQVILNKMCKDFDFIDIDENKEIFFNVNNVFPEEPNKDAIFVSYPGNLNLKRMYRGIFDYSQFNINKISFIIALIFCFLVYRKFIVPAFILLIIYILFILSIDFSCV